MKPCVYILTNDNHSVLYVGVTSDLKQRVDEHLSDVGCVFSRHYNLHKVVYIEYLPTMMAAITREKQIKSWNRARKIDLINSLNPSWRNLMTDM